jgi:hypothetical protein
VAGTAGYDGKGEPFIGAMARMLLCHKCSPRFSRALTFAWERESDRTAGRNLATMPNLRRRGDGAQQHGHLDRLPVSVNPQDDGVSGVEGPDAHDEG